MAAVAAADRDQALSLAVAAWKAGDRQPFVLMLAAEWLEANQQPVEALELLRDATSQETEEPELWRRYGQLLARLGRLDEALGAFGEALEIDPENWFVLIASAEASYRAGSLRKSLDYYRRADTIRPGNPDTLAAMAAIHVGLQDAAQARELAQNCLKLAPRNEVAQIALARADLLSHQPQAARARASEVLRRGGADKVALLDILAESLDALDLPSEAFKAYGARNALIERAVAPLVSTQLRERRVDQVRRIAAWLGSHDHYDSDPNDIQSSKGPAHHAFIVGFPRSGTTLLEKSLGGHPRISTLPEVDLLNGAADEFLTSNEGLARLAAASADELESYRARYWATATKVIGDTLDGRLLVDKLPLHTISLPLIVRLFPRARILFAIRDPRDVVLSCFRRRFQLNWAMYEMLDLPRAAEFYDAVMTLALECERALPLRMLSIRYEAVVADFERQMTAILDFVGLEWNEDVGRFGDRAGANPRTPSDLQLTKGLNTDGVYQWPRYRAQLESVLPTLDPWVRHFGYESG